MINIADAYEMLEITDEASLLVMKNNGIKGNTKTIFKFNCEYCDQSFNHDNFNLSILLYGVAFLVGPKFCYTGFTCPKCLNTIMLKSDNLTDLQQIMTFFRGPNGSHQYPFIRYHSSVIYSPVQIDQLKTYNIPTWTSPVDDNTRENFHSMLALYLEEEPDIEENYLCSYIYRDEPPIGSFASVWWFKPDDIEALVKIENENRIRVFPRYVHKMSWYERYDYFAWQYRLYQDYLASLKDSAREAYNILDEYAYQEDINLNKLYDDNPDILRIKTAVKMEQHAQQIAATDIHAASEFLDLLVNFDPALWNIPCAMSDYYKGIWKAIAPFKDASVPDNLEDFNNREYEVTISDAAVKEMTDEIRKYIAQTNVQEWAMENHQGFIKEYISLARRPDFSYGLVWDLKCQYLKQLYEIVGTVAFDKSDYAFVFEHAAWRIKFDGEVISGLTAKGLRYIHYLVANQGDKKDTLSLGSLDGDSKGIISEEKEYKKDDEEKSVGKKKKKMDVNQMADPEMILLYENKIEELKKQIEDAQKMGDSQYLKETEADLKKLKKLYSETFRHGESRKFDDGTMNERKAIARSITRAIDEIEGNKPADRNPFRTKVASHFWEAIKPISLYKISYNPKEKIDWLLE